MSLQQATDLLNRWYESEVRDLAFECLREFYDMETGELGECDDWLHETLDGHEFVMYTYKAQLVAACSRNDDEWEEQMGETEKPTYEQRAYFAMLRDVRDLLENEYFVDSYKEQFYANESEYDKRLRLAREKAEYQAECHD